jgi:hypothetical protein
MFRRDASINSAWLCRVTAFQGVGEFLHWLLPSRAGHATYGIAFSAGHSLVALATKKIID